MSILATTVNIFHFASAMPNNGGQRLPSHWPMSVTYLTASTYHSSVPGTLKRFLQGTPTATKSTYTRDQHSAVLIRRILDIDHPAFEQFGLFAGRKIPANTFIIVYKGIFAAQHDSN